MNPRLHLGYLGFDALDFQIGIIGRVEVFHGSRFGFRFEALLKNRGQVTRSPEVAPTTNPNS